MAVASRAVDNRRFAIDLARATGGAIIFAIPLLMTMEMWSLGFTIEPLRFVLFLLLTFPLLGGLSYFAGFEETFTARDRLREIGVAYAVGFGAAAAILSLFGVIAPGMTAAESVSKVAMQSVPASFGAMLARKQLGGGEREEGLRQHHARYGGQLFLMAAGALFLSMSMAPTEEMVLIAHQMSTWHAVGLVLVSLLLMHGLVYMVEFGGQKEVPPGTPAWSVFLRFTVVGYALVLAISAYILWTFGLQDGLAAPEIVQATIVLGFPSALGAAISRLVI